MPGALVHCPDQSGYFMRSCACATSGKITHPNAKAITGHKYFAIISSLSTRREPSLCHPGTDVSSVLVRFPFHRTIGSDGRHDGSIEPLEFVVSDRRIKLRTGLHSGQ